MAPTGKVNRRKYVTTACDACREGKVKCDGARPACAHCENKMRPCNYQVGSDKRKISLRFVVDLLVTRVEELFQYIVDRGLSPPPMSNENDVALKNALDILGLGHIKSALEAIGTKERQTSNINIPEDTDALLDVTGSLPHDLDLGQLDPDMELLMQPPMVDEGQQASQNLPGAAPPLANASNGSFQHLSEGDASDMGERLEIRASGIEEDNIFSERPTRILQTSARHAQQPLHEPNPQSFAELLHTESGQGNTGPQSEPKYNDQMEEIVHRLSDRMGSLQIGSDGHVRYYGPTSHFNLLRMPTPDNLTVHRTVRKDGRDYVDRLGIGKDVPKELEEHLINLYFIWHNPAFDVVDRRMYQTARQQWREHMEETPYYSEALTNAMCCLGAAFEPRYHPDFITYPRSVSDFFADRAKTLLDIELDSPCLATVQAMVILSGHDIGCKRDARGWLYSGMAMRLAFDLGLHIDMSLHVAEGSISAAEAEIRRMVFWGAYTLDHHWGFLLGRPFITNMDDVSVEKPGCDTSWVQTQQWTPYGLPYPAPTLTDLDLPNPVTLLSQYRIWLCDIMTPLGHVLYGSSKISKEDLQSLNEETTSRLLDWKEKLPPSLQVCLEDPITSPYLPHLLLLHMHYHQAIIHAHRPWMSKSSIQPQPPKGPGYNHARQMCVESATAIAKILHLYEVRYTFRRMNIQAVAITCSAALILIFATILNRRRGNDSETVAHLNVCFRALEELGLSWESAKRAQNFLLHMQAMWESRVRPYQPAKRTSQSQDAASVQIRGPKRTRTSTVSSAEDGGSFKTPDSPKTGKVDSGQANSDMEVFNWLWAASMGTVPGPEKDL